MTRETDAAITELEADIREQIEDPACQFLVVNPSNVLTIVAEVRRLRAALLTVAQGIKDLAA